MRISILNEDGAYDFKMSVQEIYTDLVCDWITQRFQTVAYGIDQDRADGTPIPFMFSKVFIARLERVVRQLVIPHMVANSSGLMTLTNKEPEDQQKEFLKKYFNDRQGRLVTWETWQAAWHATMTQKEIPAKPEPKKKGLKSLLSKKSKGSGDQVEMTEEQWTEIAKKIDTSNKVAEKAWVHMQGDGKQYTPPNKSDGQMIVGFFGRSVKVLKEQMTGIRQIVAQGGNINKTFDLFQNNKKVDLTLLSVCYQNPGDFLDGDNALKNIMRGQSARAFPLIARFLPGYIKGT